MASDSDCFSNATVRTRSWMPAATNWLATMAVDPPTEPAVWARDIGLPGQPGASARDSSGIMTPSKKSGALPMTTASMSAHVISASASASIIGFIELTKAGTMIANATFQPFVVYSCVALMYFVLCFPISLYSKHLEKKTNVR
mgnify:CR=1 FL=1